VADGLLQRLAVTEPVPRSILPMQLQIGDRFTDEEGE
jgi:hypothetical protein